jgi:hypothetical protein
LYSDDDGGADDNSDHDGGGGDDEYFGDDNDYLFMYIFHLFIHPSIRTYMLFYVILVII